MEWEMLLTDYFLKLEARGRRLYSSWFLFFFVCGDGRHLACRILVPPTGIKPIARQWKHGILTTGPQGKSHFPTFKWLKVNIVLFRKRAGIENFVLHFLMFTEHPPDLHHPPLYVYPLSPTPKQDQGLNWYTLQWEFRGLITGPLGNSQPLLWRGWSWNPE